MRAVTAMLKPDASFPKESQLKRPLRRGAPVSLYVGLQILRLEAYIQDDYAAGFWTRSMY